MGHEHLILTMLGPDCCLKADTASDLLDFITLEKHPISLKNVPCFHHNYVPNNKVKSADLLLYTSSDRAHLL